MIRAPSVRAWAANSAKYSGVACGKTTRVPDMLASPTFGSAASGAPTCMSESARIAAVGPAPWFAPNAASSSARSRSAARAAEMPESVSPPESNVISATIGRLDTARTAAIAASSSSSDENVSRKNTSTPRPSSRRARSP